MSGFFSDIMSDMKGMEQNLLGPDYLYWKRILKPSDMGMSDDGNFGALANDIGGLSVAGKRALWVDELNLRRLAD